jgi:hypothetical protein
MQAAAAVPLLQRLIVAVDHAASNEVRARQSCRTSGLVDQVNGLSVRCNAVGPRGDIRKQELHGSDKHGFRSPAGQSNHAGSLQWSAVARPYRLSAGSENVGFIQAHLHALVGLELVILDLHDHDLQVGAACVVPLGLKTKLAV